MPTEILAYPTSNIETFWAFAALIVVLVLAALVAFLCGPQTVREWRAVFAEPTCAIAECWGAYARDLVRRNRTAAFSLADFVYETARNAARAGLDVLGREVVNG
jgi:hypothetical protein